MDIYITPDLKKVYPESIFGSLIVKNIPNRKIHEALEERKRDLERRIREVQGQVDVDSMSIYPCCVEGYLHSVPVR